ncbi:MAG: TRAP transporter fused permease subunit [Deltaproteobacteria bacterium]|nr:TRAP transporter fused permease subunit [Deltaproteobacteria bacterium]
MSFLTTLGRVYEDYAEGSRRQFTGIAGKLVPGFAILYSLYHVYVFIIGVGKLNVFQHRSTHLLWLLAFSFIVYGPAVKKTRVGLWDWIPAILSIAIWVYMMFNLERITLWLSLIDEPPLLDLIFGGLLILLVLEGVRRVSRMPLVIVTVIFLLYMFWGNLLGGIWWHAGMTYDVVIDVLFLSPQGMWGSLMNISATYIILFVLFGQLLLHLGGAAFFVDLADAVAGRARGGPAKVAVVGSGLFGTISGSQIANVATSGSFTIPMMKRVGFRPQFAGGVELSASMGGMFMPPVMASTVFLMSDISGIPYVEIIVAAFIPACLYFYTVFWQVHMESVKMGIISPTEGRRSAWNVLKEDGHFILPLIVIVWVLLEGYTPIRAALVAIATLLVVTGVRKKGRKDFVKNVLKGLETGATTSIIVALPIAAGAIMVTAISATGLGGKFGSMVMLFSGGYLFPALVIAMIASLVLGAPLSVAATYILTAIMIVPVTVSLGVAPLAAHLFAVYFAVIAPMSPPAGPAMFLAGGLAGANPMIVGLIGMRLAIGAFVLPFMFVFNSGLLMEGSVVEILFAVAVAAFALFALAAGFEGWISKSTAAWERVLLVAGGFTMIFPGAVTLTAGAAAVIVAIVGHLVRVKVVQATSEPAAP